MANPAVTYTFTNGTTADGPNVSTNFSDIIAALTDGTKTLTISNLTASTINVSGLSTVANITASGNLLLSGSALGSAGTPTANKLYPDNIVKAWALTADPSTISGGFNLTVNRSATGIYDYTFKTNLANANYVVIPNVKWTAVAVYTARYKNLAASGFTIEIETTATGVATNSDHSVIVIGLG